MVILNIKMNNFITILKSNIYILKRSKIMFYLRLLGRFILIYLFAQILHLSVNAQVIVKQRSTLSLCGSSQKISTQGHQFVIQQSIGQPGIIGLSKANGLILRQGFIQPPMNLSRTNTENCLRATIHPNPFSSLITVSFAEEITERVSISIYDLYGRKVYNSTFNAAQEIIIELGKIHSGLFLLRVNTGEKTLTKKMIKE